MKRVLLALVVCGWVVTGCDSSSNADETLDLDALFAPTTASEVDAIRADWATRDVSAQDVRVEATFPVDLDGTPATMRVVSHVVAGVRHVGAIVVPDGAAPASLRIMLYGHGGDGGVAMEEMLLVATAFGPARDQFVYVVPAFRDEPLTFGDQTFQSEGPASPWDYDVDDTLALLNVALATTPEAQSERIGMIGFSRGAGVALLAGARDARIERIVAYFGPTDFFDTYVQEVVREALDGNLRDLPGMDYLYRTFIQPAQAEQLTIAEVRPELVRRSAVLFAEDLPAVQVHHGTADAVVFVSQAVALSETMTALGRTTPTYEAFIYEGGTHSPLSLIGSTSRVTAFLGALVAN